MGSGELGVSLERIGKVYFGFLERKSVLFKALRSALSVLRFSISQKLIFFTSEAGFRNKNRK